MKFVANLCLALILAEELGTVSPYSTWQPMSPTYNSEEDEDWQGEYADYFGDEGSGISLSQEPGGSFDENPLDELGIYDSEEDRSGWPFERLYADSEWQETNMKLKQDTNNFSGPQPGPIAPPSATEEGYFRRFWTDEILDKIVKETNRFYFFTLVFFVSMCTYL